MTAVTEKEKTLWNDRPGWGKKHRQQCPNKPRCITHSTKVQKGEKPPQGNGQARRPDRPDFHTAGIGGAGARLSRLRVLQRMGTDTVPFLQECVCIHAKIRYSEREETECVSIMLLRA